jgi:hypothetical protein
MAHMPGDYGDVACGQCDHLFDFDVYAEKLARAGVESEARGRVCCRGEKRFSAYTGSMQHTVCDPEKKNHDGRCQDFKQKTVLEKSVPWWRR